MSTGRNTSYAFKQKRERLLADPNACCVVCGATAEHAQLHIDHIIPVAEGGGDEDENLQVMCAKHNQQKGKRLVTYQRKEYFNERWFGIGYRG